LTDQFELRPNEVVGEGVIQTKVVDDNAGCTAACRAQPWCLAWTRDGTTCTLKDNQLPQPARVPSNGATPGCCGKTPGWASSCNETAPCGSWQALDHNISTLEECAAVCRSCPSCNYASFSLTPPSDCSWYQSCSLFTPTSRTYESVEVRNSSSMQTLSSGVRVFSEGQVLPSPRYADCLVDGTQRVTDAENELRVPPHVDAEWYAVVKEHLLAERCVMPAATAPTVVGATPSYFWTVMSQNGNAPSTLGSTDCIASCYYEGKYPPAVNASAGICPKSGGNNRTAPRLGFNALPMNQAKVMHEWTDALSLRGRFNWTYELELPLDVPFEEFPSNASFFEWEWWYDKDKGKGFTRLYTRISNQYPWIAVYFGADAGRGVKANEACERNNAVSTVSFCV
jgi:hypothetical protein